mgnify:CR=1 FL=1
MATDACISCGKCVQVCPLNNVQLKKWKNLHGVQIVRTVWHVSVIARQKQSNMERKAKENHDILLKKFLINLLQPIIYWTDIDVV